MTLEVRTRVKKMDAWVVMPGPSVIAQAAALSLITGVREEGPTPFYRPAGKSCSGVPCRLLAQSDG